jgi:membrane-associated protein
MEHLIFITFDKIFTEYSQYGYIGIFLFFITVDQLTPIPEEITLLTIGYLSSNHIFNPIIAGLISLTAFILVDSIYFFLSASGNKFIKKFLKKRKNHLITRYKEKLKKNFGPTLIVLCFIPRMRLFGPVFAGIMNLSFKKFLLFDLIGLSSFTLIYISLGMIFHTGLHSLMEKLGRFQDIIFACAMVFLAIIIFLFVRKTQQK